MASYLSSWWSSSSKSGESAATASSVEATDESEAFDSGVVKEQTESKDSDVKASTKSGFPSRSTGSTAPRLAQAGPSQPKDTFKVPALPTRTTLPAGPPSQSIRSTSSLVPPPIPSRQVPTPWKVEDIDAAPQFPLPDSAQRSRAGPSKTAASVPSFDVRPPSPDHDEEDEPLSDLNIAIMPGTVPLGNMAPPPSTTSRPAFGMQNDTTPQASKAKRREKVALGPGYSPLDWARLTQSGRNLRGVEGPKRVTLEELAEHNSQYDAWMALDGIVYNITPYVRFHPGGGKELLRGAGRDGTKLFMNTHSWVNYTHMLNECIIGPLVRK